MYVISRPGDNDDADPDEGSITLNKTNPYVVWIQSHKPEDFVSKHSTGAWIRYRHFDGMRTSDPCESYKDGIAEALDFINKWCREVELCNLHSFYGYNTRAAVIEATRNWGEFLDSINFDYGQISNFKIQTFYRSVEWRKIRYEVLQRDGAKCCLCNRDRSHGVVMNVDHIKPLRFNWDLRLDADNLQVLCEECNHGKGNKTADWRQ